MRTFRYYKTLASMTTTDTANASRLTPIESSCQTFEIYGSESSQAAPTTEMVFRALLSNCNILIGLCSNLSPCHRHSDDHKVLQEAQVSSENHTRYERTRLDGRR